MKPLVLIIALLLTANANAGNLYYALGIGLHNERIDCPEVCFADNLLGRIRIGYAFTNGIAIDVSHVSAPLTLERGRGLNAVFIEYRHNIGN